MWPKVLSGIVATVLSEVQVPPPPPTRRVVEFCCGRNSRMGRPHPWKKGCEVIRLTLDDDVTTDKGLERAMNSVDNKDPSFYIMLWGSIPCTGGSPRQRFNKTRGKATRKLIAKHIAEFRKIWAAFEKVAVRCLECGGDVCIEWPTSCDYWRFRLVARFLRKHGFVLSRLHHPM